jgi:hypothetical protein
MPISLVLCLPFMAKDWLTRITLGLVISCTLFFIATGIAEIYHH